MTFIKAFFNKTMFLVLLMGISSGLPLVLTGNTLQAWMKSEGVDLGTIGLFALVGLPYTLKFLWAPLMDRFQIGLGGRRKGWMLTTQILLALAILGLGWTNPKENLWLVAFLSLLVAFFSASQDIVLDAWRREALTEKEFALGNSIFVSGYLFSFRIISGAVALILSDLMPWSLVYTIMAACIGLGILATLLCEEPQVESPPPQSLYEAVWSPFKDFFSKPGAILVLVFILLYKIGENLAFQMSTPFYLDLGFSRSEVGAISKVVGWIALACGGMLSGYLMLRIKLYHALMLFGIIQGIATFGFALLTFFPKDTLALSSVIGLENFALGMSTTAFVSFMAQLTNKRFTATQYALLTSFMRIPSIFIAAPAGYLAQATGWFGYFSLCTLITIPGILLIPVMNRIQKSQ